MVDAYGIGTSISNAPVIDFSLDIIEIEGKPISKRGKLSGSKMVLECKKCNKRQVSPYVEKEFVCECGSKMEDILLSFIEMGKVKYELPEPSKIREFVLRQVSNITI